MTDADKAWIQTVGGGKLHILSPRQDEIDITDIAHALSMMCRFTGHTRKFYSVAEHSWHASRAVPKEDSLWALLHDASEAYIADMNRPLKHFTSVGPAYIEVERRIMRAICEKFGLALEEPPSVSVADRNMLFAEKEQFMVPMEWESDWGRGNLQEKIALKCWGPDVSRTMFLHRFYELTNQI